MTTPLINYLEEVRKRVWPSVSRCCNAPMAPHAVGNRMSYTQVECASCGSVNTAWDDIPTDIPKLLALVETLLPMVEVVEEFANLEDGEYGTHICCNGKYTLGHAASCDAFGAICIYDEKLSTLFPSEV